MAAGGDLPLTGPVRVQQELLEAGEVLGALPIEVEIYPHTYGAQEKINVWKVYNPMKRINFLGNLRCCQIN